MILNLTEEQKKDVQQMDRTRRSTVEAIRKIVVQAREASLKRGLTVCQADRAIEIALCECACEVNILHNQKNHPEKGPHDSMFAIGEVMGTVFRQSWDNLTGEKTYHG